MQRHHWDKAKQALAQGKVEYPAGKLYVHQDGKSLLKASTPAQVASSIRQFIVKFAQEMGDFMPHLDEVHLPMHTAKELWQEHGRWCERRVPTAPRSTYPYFNTIYNKEYKEYVKLPATRQFARCDTCDTFDVLIAKGATPEIKSKATRDKAEHLEGVREEKVRYQDHIHKAMSEPDKYLSIAFDAMDSSKCAVPRPNKISKSESMVESLTLPLLGMIVHGHKPGGILYPMDPRWPKDSSFHVQCLSDTIRRVAEARSAENKPLPPILFLQLDNASGGGKNISLFAYCAALVQAGIFDEVID